MPNITLPFSIGTKKRPADPIDAFRSQLTEVLRAAAADGVRQSAIAAELESYVTSIRVAAARNINLNPVPLLYDAKTGRANR